MIPRFHATLMAGALFASAVFSESQPPSQAIPGKLDSTKIPLFISLGFDDNTYADGVEWVTGTLLKDRVNPAGSGNRATCDGTPMAVDFYVIAKSDFPYPDVSDPAGADFYAVPLPSERPITDAWRHAYDIGCGVNNHTFTHNYNLSDLSYDATKGQLPSLLQEIGHCSRYLVNVAGIPRCEIYGLRTPYLASSAADNASFKATRDLGMLYDCTNDNGMQGNAQADWALPYYPGTMDLGWIWWTSVATAGLWQVPNAIYPTSAGGTFSVKGFDSGTSNGWPSGKSTIDFLNQMKWAITWHYKKNRAPLDLGLHSDYYSEQAQNTPGTAAAGFSTSLADRRAALTMLLDWVSDSLPDARIVKKVDIIRWMRNPVTIDDLSRNTELSFRTDNGSGNLADARLSHESTTKGGASTAAIRYDGATSAPVVDVTVADAVDWTLDAEAGMRFNFTKSLSGAHSVRIRYTSDVPLNLTLNQSNLTESPYRIGLPTGTKTIELPITSDFFMQSRPIVKEGILDLSQVMSASITAEAFDATKSGSFTINEFEIYGAGPISDQTGISLSRHASAAPLFARALDRNLALTIPVAGSYQIELVDMRGARLLQTTQMFGPGNQLVALPEIAAGSYLARIKGNASSFTGRVIIH